jgi:hypothetical protein
LLFLATAKHTNGRHQTRNDKNDHQNDDDIKPSAGEVGSAERNEIANPWPWKIKTFSKSFLTE